MRFRLDPRDAERDPPPAHPAPAPATAPAPPAPALPRADAPPMTAAPPARAAGPAMLAPPAQRAVALVRERRNLAIALAALLLLGGTVTVGAMYAMDAGPFAYPEQYLLRGDEMPAGMWSPPPDADAREEGITENPGELDPARVREEFSSPQPEEAWVQGFALQGDPETAVVVIALKFANEDDAKSLASRGQIACFGGGFSVLRDGDVTVFVAAESDAGDSLVPRVAAALKAQNDDLVTVCGGR